MRTDGKALNAIRERKRKMLLAQQCKWMSISLFVFDHKTIPRQHTRKFENFAEAHCQLKITG